MTAHDTQKSKRRLRWRHFGIVGILGVALLSGWIAVETAKNGARQERWRAESEQREKNKEPPWIFDPAACASDPGGMAYIALGRTVFRRPVRGPIERVPLGPDRFIPPPDPNEPEGCPGNPSQWRNLAFLYRYDALRKNKFDPKMQGSLNSLELIAARPDFWGLQLIMETQFEKLCRRPGERLRLPNGLTGCYVRPGDTPDPIEDWAVMYRADPRIYAAPFGRPFIVECWRPMHPGAGANPCSVRYKLYETVNVSYEFQPKNIPITEIIEFDRGLRERIEAMRVPDFVWPDEAGEEDKPGREGDN